MNFELLKYKNNVCFIENENEVTYAQLDDYVNSLLHKNLFKEKSLVLIKSRANVETIVGYLACLKSDMAFILIDGFASDSLLQEILQLYKPNFIWEEKQKDNDYEVSFRKYGLKIYNKTKTKTHTDLSLMLSTSGSTGSSKMVRLSKKNIQSNCDSIKQYLKIEETHRTISNLPFHYSYGLSVLNTHLVTGASMVLTEESVFSRAFFDILAEKKVTTLNGVPYTYEMLFRAGLTKMDLPDLKYLTQAGGRLNERFVTTYEKWASQTNRKFYVMYGQTEATARISYMPPQDLAIYPTSIGKAIPNGKLYLKDIYSKKIISEPNKQGELIYEGDNVMLGYANSYKDLEKTDELKGVLATGDLGKQDSKGYFYITGRLKRFIKIYGNRFGLDECEKYLHSKEFEAVCTGIDNKLVVVTTISEQQELIKNELINHYKLHHTVIQVCFMNEFPIISSGKIDYQAILKKTV